MDVLKEYIGLMQEFPDLVEIHRGAMRKVRDADRMKEEGRIDVSIYTHEQLAACVYSSVEQRVRSFQQPIIIVSVFQLHRHILILLSNVSLTPYLFALLPCQIMISHVYT